MAQPLLLLVLGCLGLGLGFQIMIDRAGGSARSGKGICGLEQNGENDEELGEVHDE